LLYGWNQLNTEDAFDDGVVKENGIIIKHSRHLSFSNNYKIEFNNIINPIIAKQNINVLFDVREVN